MARMTDKFWAAGKRGETRHCLTCGAAVTSRPLPVCTDGRHTAFHIKRRAQNNSLRKDARLAARSRGEVKRYGTPEAKKAQTKRAYRQRRLAIITRLGARCEVCGHLDHRALQVHHQHGGGWLEREEKGWRYHLDMAAMTAAELQETYRLLCANCHQVEHYDASQDAVEPSEGFLSTGG